MRELALTLGRESLHLDHPHDSLAARFSMSEEPNLSKEFRNCKRYLKVEMAQQRPSFNTKLCNERNILKKLTVEILANDDPCSPTR